MIDRVLCLDAVARDCVMRVWFNDFPVAWVAETPWPAGWVRTHGGRCGKPIEQFMVRGRNALRLQIEPLRSARPDTGTRPSGFARIAWFGEGEPIDGSKKDRQVIQLSFGEDLSREDLTARLERGETVEIGVEADATSIGRGEATAAAAWEAAHTLALDDELARRVDATLEELADVLRRGDGARFVEMLDLGLHAFHAAYPAGSRAALDEGFRRVAARAAQGALSLAPPSERRLRLVGGGRFVEVARANGDAPILVGDPANGVTPFGYFIGWIGERRMLLG